MSSFFTYVDRTLDTGEPFYVGKGNEHRVANLERNAWHDNIAKKHGMQREILLETDDEELALQREVELIAEMHTFVDDPLNTGLGCNLTPGGEGHVPCEAERQRISERQTTRWADPEKRVAWQAAMKGSHEGTTRSEEWRKKHSAAMMGKKHKNPRSVETRAKMSDAAKKRTVKGGRPYMSLSITVTGPDAGTVRTFSSLKEAAHALSAELNVALSAIVSWFVARKAESHGLTFEYDTMMDVVNTSNTKSVTVIGPDIGLVRSFPSHKEAALALAAEVGVAHTTILGWLIARKTEARGLRFEYGNERREDHEHKEEQ